jgi:Leucine-rich repeat (LRR) protein
MLNQVQHDRDRHPVRLTVTLSLTQGLKPPQKGNRVYRPEALKTIAIIEEKYKIDWNNDAQRQQLTELNLISNQITDLSPLAQLTQLTELNLWNNQITDLSPLAQLTQLTELNLGRNQITDLSPLAQLTQLTELNLWKNQITDISPLAQLTQLTKLNLQKNHITDISPLAHLTQLTTLDLEKNKITHIPEWLLALNLKITLENMGESLEKPILFAGNNSNSVMINAGNHNAINSVNCNNITLLKKELDNLFMGKMIFNTPKEMCSNESKEVILRISKNEIDTDDLAKDNKTIKEDIKISPYMKAVLKSGDFDVISLNSEEQIIDDTTVTEWQWSITPKKSKEEGQVYLTITVRIPLKHKEEYKDIPTFKRTIKILLKDSDMQSKKDEGGNSTVFNISLTGNGDININDGENSTITQTITTTNNDLKALLELVKKEANTIADQLPNDKKDTFTKLTNQIIKDADEGKKSPFFEFSTNGVLETAKTVGEVGVTFMELIPKIVEFLG